MKRFLSVNLIIYLLAIGIFANLAYVAYMKFWPFKTVTVATTTFPVKNPQPIKPGDTLVYEVDYCRYTELPADITRTIVGPAVITLVNDHTSANPGCRKVEVKTSVIPLQTPPGMYYMKITACYQVNPLRNICHYYKTTDFEVK